MAFLRHARAVAWKDLRVELRTREILATTGFFAAMLVVVFSFAFEIKRDEDVPALASGILWISVAFSGTLGLSRAFDRELAGSTMRGLLLAPAERGSIFLGKTVGVVLAMLVVEAVIVPLLAVLYRAPLDREPMLLIAFLVLGTIGFAIVGSVFAGMLLPTRSRDVLLAVCLYPVVTPALLAGIKGTAGIWSGSLDEAWWWIKFLAVFDAVFLTVSLWVFESLVIE